MAITAASLVTRIDNELVLLGNPTASQVPIIQDALTELIEALMDLCRISATLTVDSSTDEYDIPDTIDLIETIYDNDGDGVVYSVDRLQRKITFQDSESSTTGVDYTVYGTPLDVRTNYETIIEALPESYAKALWDFVVAGCHDQAQHDMAEKKLDKAQLSAHRLLMYLNSDAGKQDRTITIVDFTGQTIGASGAADGIDYDIDDLAETEDFDP